jgi:hypothetical protein
MCWQTLVPAYDGSHTATIVMIGKCLRGPFTRLSDEPGPVIQVACTKCQWKAAFSPALGRARAGYPGRMH